MEETWSCVSYPCDAGNQLLRLFLAFGHVWSGVCISPSRFNSTRFTSSFRVMSMQESPSVLWETSPYPVPAKKRVHLFAGSMHISPLAISRASLQPVLKPRNAEGRARDWPRGTLALERRSDVAPCHSPACAGIIRAGRSRVRSLLLASTGDGVGTNAAASAPAQGQSLNGDRVRLTPLRGACLHAYRFWSSAKRHLESM